MPLSDLIENNRKWADAKTRVDPDFFTRLTKQQAPDYLWIGCSDSRVPANEIVNLDPGEMFVHRNVANLAGPQDANFLSVLQYSVHVLKVKHILVVGHYGCGGVRAAVESKGQGLIDHWLSPIRETACRCRQELANFTNMDARLSRLVELNVIDQVRHVVSNPIVLNAWASGQELMVHGWVYALHDGLIRDLKVTIRGLEERARQFDF